MPFHNGHKALIGHAIGLSQHVDVLLVANNMIDIVPAHVRALSIYEAFPGAQIRVHIVDDIYTDDAQEISSAYWAEYTKYTLGYTPSVVVASENYGQTWADAMGCDFVMFDLARQQHPISGTLCRNNAYEHTDQIPAETKRYMLPRIVVLGAESTGTTTLANALGEHYNTPVVPEVGRLLDEDAVDNGTYEGDSAWDENRFWLTSRAQDALEERLAREANGVLVCDTDSFATAVWWDYYQKKAGKFSEDAKLLLWKSTQAKLYRAGQAQADKHALYILTDDDIPFVQDERGTRTGEDLRKWHTKRFKFALDNYLPLGVGYIVVSGSREERFSQATEAIDKVLDRHPAMC